MKNTIDTYIESTEKLITTQKGVIEAQRVLIEEQRDLINRQKGLIKSLCDLCGIDIPGKLNF